MSDDLDKLIQTAKEACASEGEIDEQIDRVEKYFTAFADWMDVNQEVVEAHPETYSMDKLKDLNNRHQSVVRFASDLKAKAKKDLIAQHARGKGIMTYTDFLPKKIRVTKERKG